MVTVSLEPTLWVVSVLFLAMGLYGLVAPQALVKPFGVSLDGADARTEVRAVYGGFGVAIAVMLALAAIRDDATTEPIALTVGVALFGMAGGRIVSALIERGRVALYPTWFYVAVEVLGGALLVAAVS